jgi:hypothetical protein
LIAILDLDPALRKEVLIGGGGIHHPFLQQGIFSFGRMIFALSFRLTVISLWKKNNSLNASISALPQLAIHWW